MDQSVRKRRIVEKIELVARNRQREPTRIALELQKFNFNFMDEAERKKLLTASRALQQQQDEYDEFEFKGIGYLEKWLEMEFPLKQREQVAISGLDYHLSPFILLRVSTWKDVVGRLFAAFPSGFRIYEIVSFRTASIELEDGKFVAEIGLWSLRSEHI